MDGVWIRALHRHPPLGQLPNFPSRVLRVVNPDTSGGARDFADVALDTRADQLPTMTVEGVDAPEDVVSGRAANVNVAVEFSALEKWILCVESGETYPYYLSESHDPLRWTLTEREFEMGDYHKGVNVKDLQAYFGDLFLGFRNKSQKSGPFSKKKSDWSVRSRAYLRVEEERLFAGPTLTDKGSGGPLCLNEKTLPFFFDPKGVAHRSNGVAARRDHLWGRTPVSAKARSKAEKTLSRKKVYIDDTRGIMLFDMGFEVLPDLSALEGHPQWGGPGAKILSIGYQPLLRTEGIGALNEIEELDLYQTNIHYLSSEIGQLTKLRKLNLGLTGVRALPAELVKCQALEDLTMPEFALDWDLEANLAIIAELKSLKRIKLRAKTPDEVLARVKSLLPDCEAEMWKS